MVVQASGDDMRAWRLRGCGQSGLDICGQTYDAFDAFNHVRHPDTLHRAMDFMNLWWLHYVPTFELSYFKLLFILSSSVLHVIDTTGASSLAYADAQTYWHGCFRGLIDIAGVTVIVIRWDYIHRDTHSQTLPYRWLPILVPISTLAKGSSSVDFSPDAFSRFLWHLATCELLRSLISIV